LRAESVRWSVAGILWVLTLVYSCDGTESSDTNACNCEDGGTGACTCEDGGDASACTCEDGHCATNEELCSLVAATTCSSSLDELAKGANLYQVGCGTRVLSFYNGTGPGGSYCFDLTTGELVGGTRYNDYSWGPCNVAVYSFGAPCPDHGLSCSDMVECDCRYPYQKPNCSNPVSDCLPADGGTAGASGQAGSGG
jgi:hypothetical protein